MCLPRSKKVPKRVSYRTGTWSTMFPSATGLINYGTNVSRRYKQKWGHSHANRKPTSSQVFLKYASSPAWLETHPLFHKLCHNQRYKAHLLPISAKTKKCISQNKAFTLHFICQWCEGRNTHTCYYYYFITNLSQNQNLTEVSAAQCSVTNMLVPYRACSLYRQTEKERVRNKSMKTYGWSSYQGRSLGPLS